jgi:dTDP-4-amino-4,6-dideoxygalactose transaminase
MDSIKFPVAPVLSEGDGRIVLFRPFVPRGAGEAVSEVLQTRWIGQGPKVEMFENKFEELFSGNSTKAISCGSGTDALHLAYLLAGVGAEDEVICPIFTCTATNLPAKYIGAKIIFADINSDTMNVSVEDIRKKISPKTKAIVFVDYGGAPADLDGLLKISREYGIPLIEDAAHALGATHNGQPIGSIADYTVFSFQAIKHITTGDGGMLMVKDPEKVDKARRLRWFGIDRNAKFKGIWENDITEIGYKYQMNDISAAIGLCALQEFSEVLDLRKKLLTQYIFELSKISELKQISINNVNNHAAWLHTIIVDDPQSLQKFLFKFGIESGQVHFRNDRYTIFGGAVDNCPNMDAIESHYLVLPLHTHMNPNDVTRITSTISKYFAKDT